MVHQHIIVVAYPAQGHINPALEFAKRLIRLGIEVTFATSIYAQRQMIKASGAAKGLNFAAIADGYADGFKPKGFDVEHLTSFETYGSETLRDVILKSIEKGRPVTSIIYTQLLTWAAVVARECRIPSTLLWIQPATVLDIYYYYFNGYGDDFKNNWIDPTWSIQLPGLPSLTRSEIPSFILPSNSNTINVAVTMFEEQLKIVETDEKPTVLVNTFDALEPQALKAIRKYNMIGIGPLVPSNSFTADLYQHEEGYMGWLSSKPVASVIYVSFGSLLTPSRQLMEKIAKALLECDRPFLWVIRVNENGEDENDEEQLSFMAELEEKGKIVPWCSQLEVLTHPSLGCFITHCGWNSTLESIVCGVPVIAFPQWTDQGTNAKLIENVWRTGVKLKIIQHGGEESDEIKKCIEQVMDGGSKSIELRRNADKWKHLALEALQEGGSSDKNLEVFLADLVKQEEGSQNLNPIGTK